MGLRSNFYSIRKVLSQPSTFSPTSKFVVLTHGDLYPMKNLLRRQITFVVLLFFSWHLLPRPTLLLGMSPPNTFRCFLKFLSHLTLQCLRSSSYLPLFLLLLTLRRLVSRRYQMYLMRYLTVFTILHRIPLELFHFW